MELKGEGERIIFTLDIPAISKQLKCIDITFISLLTEMVANAKTRIAYSKAFCNK